MRARSAVVACCLAVVSLAACGDDDDESLGAAVQDEATESSEPDSTAGQANEPEADADDEATTDTSEPEDADADPGDDGCHVTVTGDRTAEWSAPNDINAAIVGHWMSEQERAAAAGAEGGAVLLLNCEGPAGEMVSFFASNTASETDVPFQPATYELQPSTGGMGLGDGPIQVLIALPGSSTTWGVSEPGQLQITGFDADHIAGRFELTATDVLADVADTPSEGTVEISGTFHFDNEL